MTVKMSKILFIIDHLGCGGAERITLQLAEYLATHEHSVHLAVLNGRLNYYSCTTSVGYTDLKLSESFAYGKMWKNKALSPDEKAKIDTLLKNNFDLIITGYNNGHWLAPYLKGNIWHWIHGDLLEFRKFNNRLKHLKEHIRFFKNKRKFSKLFKNRNLITVNRDLEHKAKLYAQPNSVITIPNGVQISEDIIALSQLQHTKKWDVVFVGRLVPIKQVDHAIKAFAMSNLTGRMAIVGDGSERKRLEALVNELNVSDRVDFLGWIDNPYFFILNSSCLILTSNYEAFGLVLAESLCLNVPIVAYNSSQGVEDIFSLQENMKFFLVELNDYKDLSNKLFLCVNNPYTVLNTTKQHLSIDKSAKKFTDLIKNCS